MVPGLGSTNETDSKAPVTVSRSRSRWAAARSTSVLSSYEDQIGPWSANQDLITPDSSSSTTSFNNAEVSRYQTIETSCLGAQFGEGLGGLML